MSATHDYTNKPRTVRVLLDATATRPPGRGRGWTIEAGEDGRWRADGPNETAAAAALAERLQAFLTQSRPPMVLTFGGYTAVVSLSLGDDVNRVTWSQTVVSPDGRLSHSGHAAESWDEATASARLTVAHRATDWHDDASVHAGAEFLAGCERIGSGQYGPEELYRYASWQRAAKDATNAGRADWHAWASENAKHYPIPHPETEQSPRQADT